MKDSKRIAFLLGAGASIPAQMPNTTEITDRVLSGNGFTTCSGLYVRMQTQQPSFRDIPDERVALVSGFVQILKSEIAKNYDQWQRRAVNYEDIYYIASQLSDDLQGEYENPVVLSFVREIKPLVEALFSRVRGRSAGPGCADYLAKTANLAMETTNYIKDVVCHSLSKSPTNLESLSVLGDACSDAEFSEVDIFTLNHDKLLETYLAMRNVVFADGFETDAPKVRRWNPASFENENLRVRLFKLHGSVNWFTFHRYEGNALEEFCGIPVVSSDCESPENDDADRLERVPRPLLLIGTFNKMLRYMSGVFAELHWRFYRELLSARYLVVSGYSLGDKGINERILEWALGNLERRMVLVCPEISSQKENARGAFKKNWDSLKSDGRLIEIEQGIEAANWSEIKQLLTA